jgi:hypothetical protein
MSRKASVGGHREHVCDSCNRGLSELLELQAAELAANPDARPWPVLVQWTPSARPEAPLAYTCRDCARDITAMFACVARALTPEEPPAQRDTIPAPPEHA